jgi:hypothetical protein
MKLAEALTLRADCQKRLAQLKARLVNNVKVQEGDTPSEAPQDLFAELGRVTTELRDLMKRINRTNAAIPFGDGMTLSDALADRDVLAIERNMYLQLAETASSTRDRMMRTEIKYVAMINVAETQKHADELAKKYRELDTRIQELNWQTELAE